MFSFQFMLITHVFCSFIYLVQDATIRSCDFATEQTLVLHSPEKKTDHVSIDTEVHLALTPLEPIVFFGFHKRMSVTGYSSLLSLSLSLSLSFASEA